MVDKASIMAHHDAELEGGGDHLIVIDFGSGRNTACATLGLGLAVSAFPLYVPV